MFSIICDPENSDAVDSGTIVAKLVGLLILILLVMVGICGMIYLWK